MLRIAAVAQKELKQFWRDRLTLGVTMSLPLIQLTLFATALTLNIRNLPLAVDDEDRTQLSRKLIDSFVATGKFRLHGYPQGTRPETVLDEGSARAVVRIPPDFSTCLRAGRPAAVQVLIDGTDSNSAVLIRNVSAALAQTFQPLSGAPALRPPVRLVVEHWYNPGLSDRWFFGSGALGMVLILFPALLGALAAAREHENGNIVQAYASTMRAPEWILGKMAPYVLVGLGQLVICFLLGWLFFDYQAPEHPLVLLVAASIYIAAAVLYGMAVGNALGTQAAAIQAVQLGAFLLSMLLSGFLVPVRNMPVLLQYISLLLPARHFIAATRDVMLRGGNWDTSGPSVLALLALAGLFFAANVGRMRRMQLSH